MDCTVNSWFGLCARRINIMDSVLKMMEKYATNLEEIVAGRTRDLMDEKKRSDRLLYRMLPT